MEKKATKLLTITAALAFILGVASITIAQDNATGDDTQQNMTSQRRGEMHGMGKHQRESGIGVKTDALSEEQIEKLQAARNEFQTATRDLRMELQSKRLALRSELAKKEPEAKTAKSLQKEISALNAELAEKRIEHLLELKKIAPYAGLGRMQYNTDDVETGRSRRNT